MSRKDYIAASTIIRTSKLTPKQRDDLGARFADYFERDNARFDRARFLEAADASDWPFLGRPNEAAAGDFLADALGWPPVAG